MRILLLGPNQINRYNWGHQLFRNEIGKQHKVTYYGAGYSGFNKTMSVPKVIKKKCKRPPELIITYGWRYSKDFKGLGDIDIPKVHITVDYGRPVGIPKQNKFIRKNKYDLLFTITQNAYRLMTENIPEIPNHIIPFSVDTNIYKPLGIPKENVVLAAFNSRPDVYPERAKMQKILRKMGVKVITKRIIHQRLIRAINRSKITITSNNIFKSLSMRYTETLACGGFLMADKPEDLEFIGLEDGKHLVIYDGIKDFKRKIKYYLDPKNEGERSKIAKAGMNFVRKNHSCKVRVKEMTDIIHEELGI